MTTHSERRQAEFVRLLDQYRKERGKEPDSIDVGTMLRESEERAKKVQDQEGSKA